MSNKVRVRFAPSPTGPLHIGGIRTALYNYLFAKKNKGDFILRIEDTDQNRYVQGAEDYIINSLNWCGLYFDEGPGKESEHGPFRQSERKSLYKKYADLLISSGKAYYAFDSPESLNAHRKEHEKKGKTFIYNWHNRLKLDNSLSLSPEELQRRLDNKENFVVRFYSPQDEVLLITDIIRGDIQIDTNTLDDKVLFKSDGMPTYHLANIVDDHLMEISHVIRGEEWLPSLALHVLLYEAFGWQAPKFAHLPLIMKPEGKGKLSKRDGEKGGFPIFPLSWGESLGYKEAGYFPEAVVNFLALLGWNPGTEQEFFKLDELIENFDLKKVHKSGARFDPEKTKWYNHHYLQEQEDSILLHSFKDILFEKLSAEESFDHARTNDDEYIAKVISFIKERASFVHEFWELSHYFFQTPNSYNERAVKKQWKDSTPAILNKLIPLLEAVQDFSSPDVEEVVKTWIGKEGLSFGQVMAPLRLVMVGDLKGPHLFDIMAMIGQEESIKRIRLALNKL